jgi:RES domain-containing protein
MNIVFRLATEKYCDDITGQGAKLYGGRWNPIDFAMLYASSHISLAALEIIVHFESRKFYQKYMLLDLQLPETEDVKILNITKLKNNWEQDMAYTQSIGKDFLNSDLFIMQVPSIVVSREHNFLINPNHALFKKVKINSKALFNWDKRF